jgi:hypothetical protein
MHAGTTKHSGCGGGGGGNWYSNQPTPSSLADGKHSATALLVSTRRKQEAAAVWADAGLGLEAKEAGGRIAQRTGCLNGCGWRRAQRCDCGGSGEEHGGAEAASTRGTARCQRCERCERCRLARRRRRRAPPPGGGIALSARNRAASTALRALAPPAPPSPACVAPLSASEQPSSLSSCRCSCKLTKSVPPRSPQAASTIFCRPAPTPQSARAPAAASPPRGRALLETASLPGQEGMRSDAEECARPCRTERRHRRRIGQTCALAPRSRGRGPAQREGGRVQGGGLTMARGLKSASALQPTRGGSMHCHGPLHSTPDSRRRG